MPKELVVVPSDRVILPDFTQQLRISFDGSEGSLQKYTMRNSNQNFPIYDFYIDEQLKVHLVHRYSDLGPQDIFVRNLKSSRSVYSTRRERDFTQHDEEWVYSPLLLEDRFKIKDPIVRDAFSPEVNLDRLVFNYRLVSTSSGRGHDIAIDEIMMRMGIYNGA